MRRNVAVDNRRVGCVCFVHVRGRQQQSADHGQQREDNGGRGESR